MPSPSFARYFSERWEREVAVVTNGSDPMPPPAPAPQDGAILTHLGTLYPARQDLTGFWEALRRVLRRDPRAIARIQFIGELSDEGHAEITRCGLQHLVTETGHVPHEEARRLTAESTVLFSGGESARDPIARGVVPAKLFEYLATDRPVLYLGDPAGDAATLLSGHAGCWVIKPHDVDAITEAIRQGLVAAAYERDTSHLSRRVKAGVLAAILDDVEQAPASKRRWRAPRHRRARR
jgi:glycosyltransferase involved in cell wall biosynthesis